MFSTMTVYISADQLFSFPAGVCRKQLGLTFLGETSEMSSVVGDICLEVDGIDREV